MQQSSARLLTFMMRYNLPDSRRIAHAIKVYTYAQRLGSRENLPENLQQGLEWAAILHDIGIHRAEKKHRSAAGCYQELEGPPVAAKLLKKAGLTGPITDRVLFLVGHHHSYQAIDGLDFQLLIEADLLVNMEEDAMEPAACRSIVTKYFKSELGKKLAEPFCGA